MIEEYLDVVAITAMAVIALVAFSGVENASTPSVCQAVRLAFENPGSELRVFGKFHVEYAADGAYLSCGLFLPKERILTIEKTRGYLIVGSTADGKIYVK